MTAPIRGQQGLRVTPSVRAAVTGILLPVVAGVVMFFAVWKPGQ